MYKWTNVVQCIVIWSEGTWEASKCQTSFTNLPVIYAVLLYQSSVSETDRKIDRKVNILVNIFSFCAMLMNNAWASSQAHLNMFAFVQCSHVMHPVYSVHTTV